MNLSELPVGTYIVTEKKLVRKPSGCFRHYKRWTDEEVALCADFSQSDEQVATQLCRTVQAIIAKRSQIRFCQQQRKQRRSVRPTT